MKKTLSLILALCMIFSLVACSGGSEPTPSPTDTPETKSPETQAPASGSDISTPAPSASDSDLNIPEAELSKDLPVNIMVLNGTTGFGMAKLMDDAKNGKAALSYNISVETDAANITAALVNGSADIAALPTNAAAALYAKTQGKVQMLAINTLGVLYVVTKGDMGIESLSDLAGKTVYSPAQNPAFIFEALCKSAGVENVSIDTSFAQPADLRTAVAAGQVDIAVLPEPMVTIACSANAELKVALDLTKAWDEAIENKSLVQGCVVVRREFAEAHPGEVNAFLKEYEASIAYLSEDTASAAQMIVDAGIFNSAPVAQKAIPNCNILFVKGHLMKGAMSTFFKTLAETAPQSIGGAVPGDDFYYIP